MKQTTTKLIYSMLFIIAFTAGANAQIYELQTETGQTYTSLTGTTDVGITSSNPTGQISSTGNFTFFDDTDFDLSNITVNLSTLSLRINNTAGDNLFVYGAYTLVENPQFLDGTSSIGWKQDGDWLKVEFKDISFEGMTSSELLSIQIWLNTADFTVKIVYGPNSTGISSNTIAGIDQRNSGLAYMRGARAEGTPNSPTLGDISTAFLDTPPEDGVIYTFTNTTISSVSVISEESFNVYPNPASDILYIDVNASANNIVNVSLVNMHGSVIIDLNNQNKGSIKLNTADIQPGIYILQIKTESNVFSRKIVIE